MTPMKRRSKRKRWSDLSPVQQRATVSAGIVQVALCIAALADIRRRPAEEIKGRKAVWAVVSICLNTVGPLAYFIFGRKR
jgi:Phospholipase_D-nuclease N-terminal